MKPRLCAARVWIGLIGLSLLGSPAQAVEYRLLVAGVFDTPLTSFVTAKELTYGASGPGIGAVVGLSGNALNADLVYLVVQQGDQPASDKAVISGGDPDPDREGCNKIVPGFQR